MDKRKFFINNRASLEDAFRYAAAFGFEKAYQVEVKPMTRTLEQNAKVHAIFGELATSATWGGDKLTAEQWKVLMISAHTIATKELCKMVIGIEGEVVNLRESSAQMTVARLGSLIEYIHAWAADNGIKFKDAEV